MDAWDSIALRLGEQRLPPRPVVDMLREWDTLDDMNRREVRGNGRVKECATNLTKPVDSPVA